MRRYLINFRKSVSDRKAAAFRNLQPIVKKVYNPIKGIHSKYLVKPYGQSKKR